MRHNGVGRAADAVTHGDAGRLRVLLVNQYYHPADAPTAALMADVAKELAAQGHEVQVIASRRGYRDASVRFPHREQIDGVHIRRVGGTGFDQGKRLGRIANYFAFFASAGRQLLVTRRPDVIVSLSTPPLLATVAQAVASVRRVRFVYWVMDVHPELAFRLGHLKPHSLTGRLLEWSGRRTLGKADTVIALGDDMAAKLQPYSNGSTRVVRTWSDDGRIEPFDAPDHPVRKAWGWDGKFVVAYSGTMGLVHEFDTILDAATRLDGDDRYLFCFICEGARADDVRAEAKRRQLTNVEFRPYVPVEGLRMSLTAPNLHLVSLRSDLAGLSLPSKTYSILAAGKPIAFVGPEGSDIASIVESNRCGVHITNGDDGRLAQTIEDYARCPETLQSLGVAARQTYQEKFCRSDSLHAMTTHITSA